ncbi:MAG: hypothetical protein KME20_07960 [Kaiparowitsia implicata GSE-PSE-MK54-09C]|nr:hypothetical protein [Kaiparowitsia implicata GSE-PSE-MK54-09C]
MARDRVAESAGVVVRGELKPGWMDNGLSKLTGGVSHWACQFLLRFG